MAISQTANPLLPRATEEIKQSSRTLAYDLMLFYEGNQTGKTPGILPGPPADGKGDYYWWEAGAMMGTYIDYWHLTGDPSYNQVVMQGMLHQVGEYENYQPSNVTASLGNDDQAFWGMSAMLAAENKFPNPPDDKPQWLALAQAVWNSQAAPERHDNECGGGLRWQIPYFNVGYDYKNTISNVCFMNMGARLARYTGNNTYAEWAEKQYDWLWGVKYIDNENWSVYDGGHIPKNCTDINKATFTYNAALLIQSCAFMYNYVSIQPHIFFFRLFSNHSLQTNGEEKWKTRIDNLLEAYFRNNFKDGIAIEPNCEFHHTCSTDMLTFKGFAHRWLSVVTQIAPYTREKILPKLRSSAEAAVNQCTGGETGRVCGFYWYEGKFVDPAIDQTTGAGEAMSVLAAVSSLLIDSAAPPTTAKTGGISEGDPNAGGRGRYKNKGELGPITTADRAGAGIITALLLGGIVAVFVWMII